MQQPLWETIDAPRPPSEAVTVLYGREDGKLKGVDEALLLDPPVALVDPHFRLRERDHEPTLRHIRAENAYADSVLEAMPGFSTTREGIFARLRASMPPPSPLLWWRGADAGGWEYSTRPSPAGPHPLYLRRRANAAAVELILDANAAPARLPSAHDPRMSYLGSVKGVSAFVPSPSGRYAAYTVDVTGEERFGLMVVELAPVPFLEGAGGESERPSEMVAHVADVDVDVAWGSDDSELYYASMDETGRPWRLHRLRLP